MHASRPIPIRSPRDVQTLPGLRQGSKGVSQSLPMPASPHIGSLKAPPEYLTTMPPLSLPMSYTENEQQSVLRKQKDVLARSAPAADLQPQHRYQIEEKRRSNRTSVEDVIASSLREASLVSLSASFVNKAPAQMEEQHGTSLGQSLGTSLSALRIREIIEEEHITGECDSPEVPQPKGVVLSVLQKQMGVISPREEKAVHGGNLVGAMTSLSLGASSAGGVDDDLDLPDDEDDDELQFELS